MILPIWIITFVLGLACVSLIFADWPRAGKASDRDALFFQIKYLGAWYLCALGDWLQGPLVFKMTYQHLGDAYLVNQLLGIGYLSGMFCAFFAGGFADKYSRKRSCQAYCICYIIGCGLTHFRSYWALFCARLLGGAATCILYSCFDAYYVKRHRQLRYDDDMLNDTLKRMWFGNYLIAIVAGLICTMVLNIVPTYHASESSMNFSGLFYVGGETAVFDTALLSLILGFLWISFLWNHDVDSGRACGRRSFPLPGEEGMESYQSNESFSDFSGQSLQRTGSIPLDIYGNNHLKPTGIISHTLNSCSQIYKSDDLWRLGMLVLLTESAMYVFIPSWDPALTQYGSVIDEKKPEETIDRGAIFASMMMACMCGAQYFSYRNRQSEKQEADRRSKLLRREASRDAAADSDSKTNNNNLSNNSTSLMQLPYPSPTTQSVTGKAFGASETPSSRMDSENENDPFPSTDDSEDKKASEFRLLESLYGLGQKSSWTSAICFLGLCLFLLEANGHPSQSMVFSHFTKLFTALGVSKDQLPIVEYYITVTAIFSLILVYEFTVGFFFPLSGLAKALIVPEENRATIYNLYRIPLNFVAVLILFAPQLAESLPRKFGFCFLLLAFAALTFRKMRNALKLSFEERNLTYPIMSDKKISTKYYDSYSYSKAKETQNLSGAEKSMWSRLKHQSKSEQISTESVSYDAATSGGHAAGRVAENSIAIKLGSGYDLEKVDGSDDNYKSSSNHNDDHHVDIDGPTNLDYSSMNDIDTGTDTQSSINMGMDDDFIIATESVPTPIVDEYDGSIQR